MFAENDILSRSRRGGTGWPEVKGHQSIKTRHQSGTECVSSMLASRDDNCLRGGSEDETIADSREGERKLCRKVTCGGVCDVSGIMLRLRVRRK